MDFRNAKIKALSIFVLLVFTVIPFVQAGEPEDLDVKWGDDFQSLSFHYLGGEGRYPEDLINEKFPSIGAKPEIHFEGQWPVVAMRARWSISTKGWPAKYRSEAIDLILMYACDAQLYEYIYPEYILSSNFTGPPEFRKDAADPKYPLAEALRGKEVGYEIVAKGGFGAADYKIRTRIRIGLSKDGKTVFYYDRPDYISDHLQSREYLFAGRDAGDEMHFEVIMLSVCKDRKLFQAEAVRRVKATGAYFVERLYEDLDDAPTEEGVEKYLNWVMKGEKPVKDLTESR